MYKQTAKQRKQRIDMQKKLFDSIPDTDDEPLLIQTQPDKTSLAVHFILKIIPLALVAFDQLTQLMFEEQYTAELIIIFIVIEFWVTKNYTGKRMLGYKWFFGEDQYGQQRLMFECRANAQLIDQSQPRLFWIIQVVYVIIAWLLFAEALLIIPNAVRIESRKIHMNLMLIVSGVANIFCFYMVSNPSKQIQESLRRQVGIDYVKRLGMASIISYY